LFEFGKVYGKNLESKSYFENERLMIYMTGNVEPENWQIKTRAVNFYDLAQSVTQVLSFVL